MTFEEKLKELGFYVLYDFGNVVEYRNKKYGTYKYDVKLTLDSVDKTIKLEFTHEQWLANKAPGINMSLLNAIIQQYKKWESDLNKEDVYEEIK